MRKFFCSHAARRIIVCLIFLAAAAAIVLGFLVRSHPVTSLDLTISQAVQARKSPALLLFMEIVSFFGIPAVAIAVTTITAAIFFFTSYRREALFTLLTLLTGGMTIPILKVLINRQRPTEEFIGVYEKLFDAGFPSGHVVYYVVFFGFLLTVMVVIKKIPWVIRFIVGAISIALIVFVSISRIYLGAHWASDIVGGYCIGFVLLSGLLHFYFKGGRYGPF